MYADMVTERDKINDSCSQFLNTCRHFITAGVVTYRSRPI